MDAQIKNIAKHFKEVYFGGNWTTVNLKDTLSQVTWLQATTKIADLNTIARLTYHINYYLKEVSKVLQGEQLQASDKLSFDVLPIACAEDWKQLVDQVLQDGSQFALLIEQLPGTALDTDFTDPKYGSYYRNLNGIIEHTHYHLGQISLIRKLLVTGDYH